MDADRYRRIRELFFEACELAPDDQQAFLDEACGDDGELRSGVAELLEADRADSTPLELLSPQEEILRIQADSTATSPESEEGPIPESIGRYRILRRLGSGGMGVVYEAEQDSPRRTVALKVIREGMSSPDVLRRFGREAEVLGQLRHPGIAQIYEAGTSDDRQPFFAMELVHGEPLHRYAESHDLSTEERLELVARVCDAVQHAHRRGVIHRDLKPGNILVALTDESRTAQPKVLDFGVARVTDADVQTATLQTGIGQIIGTLAYMSPEQATGDPQAIDVRSDVYSLGAILYELLSGRTPQDVGTRPIYDALRAIREEEPSRLGSTSRIFRGDIETIVAKALEKEKERRYQTAADLGADIRRFLANEPIVARPTTAFYQLRKFARRNKALVGGVTIAFAAMLVGTIVAVWQATIALRRSEDALFQADRARLIAAAAAVESDDPTIARGQLEAIEPGRRGWEWQHWWNRIDESVGVLDAGEPIAGASFDPAGTRVSMVGRSGRMSWWDVGRLEILSTHELTAEPVHVAAFDPRRRRVAAAFGEEGRAIGLWDTASSQRLAVLEGLEAPCETLRFTTDGSRLVGAALAPFAWIWDGESAEAVRVKSADLRKASQPRALAFLPGEERFVLSAGPYLSEFELGSGRRDREVKTGAANIYCLQYMEDLTHVVVGDALHKIYVGDTATSLPLALLQGHHSRVLALALNPDETLLASAGDQTVRVWDMKTRQQIEVFTGHEDEVRSVVFSPDGSSLLSVSDDRTARVWKVAGAEKISELFLMSHPRCVVFTPDGHRLVAGTWTQQIHIVDASSGALIGGFPATEKPQRINDLAVSHDGRFIISGENKGPLRIWDARIGTLLATANDPGKRVYSVAISPDDRVVATSSLDGCVRLWALPELEPTVSRPGKRRTARGVCFSPDGARLAAAAGMAVEILDARTLQAVKTLHGHTKQVICLDYNQDGSLLASGSDDGTLRVWDTRGGRTIHVLRGHNDTVLCVAFAPDRPLLASGSRDTTVRLWDLENGAETTQLRGHVGLVLGLDFSPDGSSLVSASSDAHLRVWDTAPRWTRWRARRVRKTLLEDFGDVVTRLFEELGDAASVLDRLERDEDLDPDELEAARQLVLRHSLLQQFATGETDGEN